MVFGGNHFNIPKGGDPSNPKNFLPIAKLSVILKLFHKILPKGGDPSNPKNFLPIAMLSVIPKLCHKILAKWLESYLLMNGIINPSIQK